MSVPDSQEAQTDVYLWQQSSLNLIFYREQLMSTGIGLGIGIPHVRFGQIGEPVAAVGVQPKGIKDYVSIDDEAVRIVIMIIAGRNQHKEHIRLLSLIVGQLKQEGVKDSLLHAENPQQIHTIVSASTPLWKH